MSERQSQEQVQQMQKQVDESGNYSSEFNATMGNDKVIPEALSSSNAAPDATLGQEEPTSQLVSADVADSAAAAARGDDLKAGAASDSD